MGSITDWSVGGCCCVLVGPWDIYSELEADAQAKIPRVASIYFDDPPTRDSDGPSAFFGTPAAELYWVVEMPNGGTAADFQEKAILATLPPLGEETELFYLTMQSAGHSIKKLFQFTEDTEILSEGSVSEEVVFEWYETDGNPAGCARFTTIAEDYVGGVLGERAKSDGYEWKDYGVPLDAVRVVSVELIRLDYKVAVADDKLVGHGLTFSVLDEFDVPVTEEDTIFSKVMSTSTTPWRRTKTADPPKLVLSGHDAPTDIANLAIDYAAELDAGDVSEDVRIDNVKLQIHYLMEFTGQANAKIDSEEKVVTWIVSDDDWIGTIIDTPAGVDPAGAPFYAPIMPIVATNSPCVFGHAYTDAWPFNSNENSRSHAGSFGSDDRLMRWQTDGVSSATGAALGAILYYHWKITNGVIEDTEVVEDADIEYFETDPLNLYDGWTIVITPTNLNVPYDWDYPEYAFPNASPRYVTTNIDETTVVELLASYQSWFYPVGQAHQADRAIGTRYRHFLDFPGDYVTYSRHNAGVTFTAKADLAVGPITLATVTREDYDFIFPTVTALEGDYSLRIENAETYTGFKATDPEEQEANDFSNYTPALWIHVAEFDATKVGWGILGNYKNRSDIPGEPLEASPGIFGTFYEYKKEHLTELFALSTASGVPVVDELPVWTYDYDSSSYDEGYEPDPFFPHRFGIRACQTREEDRKNGDERPIVAVFSRRPFDQDESDGEFDGSSTIIQKRLTYYRDAEPMWFKETPINYAGLAVCNAFEIACDPDPVSPQIAVRQGGGAGGEVTFTVYLEIVQVGGDDPESAVYDRDTHTLRCEIDIAGGHDSLGHLGDLINDGGDFVFSSAPEYYDDTILEGSNDGDFIDGSDVFIAQDYVPAIHDSSDRFVYVSEFPLRVLRTLPTDIEGRDRIKSLGAPGALPTVWQISHDGEIVNPCGEGTDPHTRAALAVTHNVGDAMVGMVKISERIDYCPEIEEI